MVRWHHTGSRAGKPNESEGASVVRIQIYTNDREQPLDLEVLEMRTKVRDKHERELTVEGALRRSDGPRGDKGPGQRRVGQPALYNARWEGRCDLLEHRQSRRGRHVLVERPRYRRVESLDLAQVQATSSLVHPS